MAMQMVNVLFLNIGVDIRSALCAAIGGEGVYPSFYDWPRIGNGAVFECPRLRGQKPRFDLVILDCGVDELPEQFFPWREPLVATLAEYAERPIVLTTHLSVVNTINSEVSQRTILKKKLPQPHYAERAVEEILMVIRQQKEDAGKPPEPAPSPHRAV